MSHIAGLDASDAEDEPGVVEEGARSPSLILNSLHSNLQSATLTALYAACFQDGYGRLDIMFDIILDIISDIIHENL